MSKREDTSDSETRPSEWTATSPGSSSIRPVAADLLKDPNAQWYLRGPEGTQGPISSLQLIAAASTGTISSETRVGVVATREWIRAAEITGLFAPHPPETPDLEPTGAARPLTPSLPSNRELKQTLAECHEYLIHRHTDHGIHRSRSSHLSPGANLLHGLAGCLSFLVGVSSGVIRWTIQRAVLILAPLFRSNTVRFGLFVALVVGTLTVLDRWDSFDDQAHAELNRIATSLDELRRRQVDETEWNRFAGSTRQSMVTITSRLEKTARSDTPRRLHLMWAARDYLPRLLEDSREFPSQNECRFREHLYAANRIVRETSMPGMRNPGPLALIAFNLLLVSSGLTIWLLRRWTNSQRRNSQRPDIGLPRI